MFDISEENLARVKALLDESPAIDFHTHLGLWETRGIEIHDPMGRYPGDEAILRHVRAMLDAGCRSASLNICSDLPIIRLGAPDNVWRDFEEGEAWREYQRLIRQLHELLEIIPAAIARRPDDLAAIHERGDLALMLSVEGAHMIEDDPGRLEQLYADGIGKFQPLHYARSRLGDIQTNAPEFGGLSDLGKEAVRRAAALGMVIDSAHATLAATADMAEAAGGPMVLSHTLMRHDSKISPPGITRNPRWIDADHARLIAETGGVVGCWVNTAPIGVSSAQELVEAVLALIDVVGIDHVCWSTDLLQVGLGDWFPDFSAFPGICAMFLDAGLGESELKQFLSDNVLRVHAEALQRSTAGHVMPPLS